MSLVFFDRWLIYVLQCDVSFNGEEYVLKATKDYTKGEEVYMNYGSHSNDLLLGECELGPCAMAVLVLSDSWPITRRFLP